MRLTLLKAKLHGATVTDANLLYEGSISIDPELCARATMKKFERVDVYNVTNGARFSTYVIYGKPGEFCLNGACARLAHPGDKIIVAAYADFSEEEADVYQPKLVFLDEKNRPKDR